MLVLNSFNPAQIWTDDTYIHIFSKSRVWIEKLFEEMWPKIIQSYLGYCSTQSNYGLFELA
jgi:hypothetical protein